MDSRRFIVTGGAGFIGSALARRILGTTCHRVLVVDNLTYASNLESLRTVARNPRFQFVCADICDAASMQETIQTFRPDVVMNLAAETHVDRSIDGPTAFVETNVKGTFVLLQAVLEYWETLLEPKRDNFRFHHVSTDEVFGSLGPSGSFTEKSPYRPNSPYAATKAASDHLVRAWGQTYGLPVVISNSSNNFGPFQFPEKLMPTVILKALAGDSIPVYGAGANVRDWLYVDDHAAALMHVAEKGRVGESYNLGAECERANLDVVREICRTLDEMAPNLTLGSYERLVEFVVDRPGHDFRYALDSSRARRELGWTPTETFTSGVRKTVRWYLDNRAWWEQVRSEVYNGERLGLGPRVPLRRSWGR